MPLVMVVVVVVADCFLSELLVAVAAAGLLQEAGSMPLVVVAGVVTAVVMAGVVVVVTAAGVMAGGVMAAGVTAAGVMAAGVMAGVVTAAGVMEGSCICPWQFRFDVEGGELTGKQFLPWRRRWLALHEKATGDRRRRRAGWWGRRRSTCYNNPAGELQLPSQRSEGGKGGDLLSSTPMLISSTSAWPLTLSRKRTPGIQIQ